MDAIYLYNKYGKPVSYDQWVAVRDMIDYVCTAWREEDMSIWEVRGKKQNFVYSKVNLPNLAGLSVHLGLTLNHRS